MLSYESDVGAALGRAWVVLEAKSNLHCAKPKYAICYTTFVAAGGGLWRKNASGKIRKRELRLSIGQS